MSSVLKTLYTFSHLISITIPKKISIFYITYIMLLELRKYYQRVKDTE